MYKERKVWADNVRVKSTHKSQSESVIDDGWKEMSEWPVFWNKPETLSRVWFEGKDGKAWSLDTPVYRVEACTERRVKGPAVLLMSTSTVIIEPHCSAFVNKEGSIVIELEEEEEEKKSCYEKELLVANPIDLSVTANRFMSIAE